MIMLAPAMFIWLRLIARAICSGTSPTTGDTGCLLFRRVTEDIVIAGSTTSYGDISGDIYLVKTDIELGLTWTTSSANSINLYRGATDVYWNYVRVRIRRITQAPKAPLFCVCIEILSQTQTPN